MPSSIINHGFLLSSSIPSLFNVLFSPIFVGHGFGGPSRGGPEASLPIAFLSTCHALSAPPNCQGGQGMKSCWTLTGWLRGNPFLLHPQCQWRPKVPVGILCGPPVNGMVGPQNWETEETDWVAAVMGAKCRWAY